MSAAPASVSARELSKTSYSLSLERVGGGALVDQRHLQVDAGALLDRGLDGLGQDVAAVPDEGRGLHEPYGEPLAGLGPEAVGVPGGPAGLVEQWLALAVSPP